MEVRGEFACADCGDNFHILDELGEHVRRAHNRPLSRKCKHCSYATDTQYDLRRHIRIRGHYNRTYKCDVCSMIYFTKGGCDGHMKRNHNYTPDRPFLCTYCPENFPTALGLNRHVKKKHVRLSADGRAVFRGSHHGPFSCTKCSIAFTRRIELDNHECARSKLSLRKTENDPCSQRPRGCDQPRLQHGSADLSALRTGSSSVYAVAVEFNGSNLVVGEQVKPTRVSVWRPWDVEEREDTDGDEDSESVPTTQRAMMGE